MKQQNRIFLLLCVLTILLSGCSGNSITQEEVEALEEFLFETQTEQTQPIQETQPTSAEVNILPPTAPPTESTLKKSYVEITSASSFSDGIAWVRYIDMNDNSRIGLLNTSGEIISLKCTEEVQSFGADFSAGYSFINLDDGFVIIDKQGNVTAQSSVDESYEIMTGGDGVYLVYQEIRSFTESEDLYGFIDVNGNWIVEPTSEHPFIYGIDLSGESYAPTFTYQGEHVFTSDHNGWDYSLYNVDTGNSFHYTDGEIHRSGKFYNGIGMIADEDTVYAITTDGKLTALFKWSSYNDIVHYSEGIFFLGTPGKYTGNFYDSNGNLLFDLSKYKLFDTNAQGNFYRYINGAAAVRIKGADGNTYIALIDTNGNFITEPMRSQSINGTTSGKDHGTYNDGMIFVRGINDSVVLHSDGTVLSTECSFMAMSIDKIIFNDGLAWQERTNCFVDSTGEKLLAYILE